MIFKEITLKCFLKIIKIMFLQNNHVVFVIDLTKKHNHHVFFK